MPPSRVPTACTLSGGTESMPAAVSEPDTTAGAPLTPGSLRRRELPAAVALGLLGILAFGGDRLDQSRLAAGLARDNGVLIGSERLLSAMKDVETGQRGFLLTGDEAYLQPYHAALPVVHRELASLGALSVRLDGLPELVSARIESADAGIATRRAQGLAGAANAIGSGRGKDLMDAVRAKVASLQAIVSEQAAARIEAARGRSLWMNGAAGLAMLGAAGLVALYAVRRRREARSAAALLQNVLENAPIGLGLLDRGLRVRHMNRSLAAMGDRALGVSIGSGIWDVMPDLREALADKLERVVTGGRAIPNIDVTAANPARPDQVRQFQVSFYPLATGPNAGDEAGQGAGMVVTDVTTRNRLERRVRDSETRFRTLTENSAAIIWTTSAAGDFAAEQPQWMHFTGQSADAASGSGWLDAVHPDDRAFTADAWRRTVEAKRPFTVEHRLRRADGEWRNMAVQAVPVLDEDGELREWVGMHTDITERVLAQEALAAARDAAEAANRAKSTFLANMSHELRTPLSAVIGYSEMLEEELEELSEPHLVADIRKIESNARHLLSLINDVLDLSKVEANRMTSYAEDFDVAKLAQEAAATVDALVQKKANTLRLELGDGLGEGLAEGLGSMHSDVVKLRQCLFNLISNAAKFTEHGQITLAIRRFANAGADWLEFRVADTGIGMSEEQLGRLFQRFAQADESTTRNFGGTGLGLALTRAFCRLLGGEITVESQPGQGTAFTMRLPAIMPEQHPLQDGEAHAPAATADGKHVVLVVDDDPAQRELLTRFLQREGFAVRTAADGRAGLEMARNIRPRAILLDVMMPQMDGWSVLRALKADPELAAIPVVMASFVHEPGLASVLGAADYVVKPVEWDQLKAVMQRFQAAEGSVLVVDDDPDARARVRAVLERNDWVVTEAGNGEEALLAVEQSAPQLILLDLTMPVMDGFTFLDALRERPGGKEIAVVVLSARDLNERDRARLSSADRLMRKGDIDLRHLPEQLADIRHVSE